MKRLTIKLTTTDYNCKAYIKTLLEEMAEHEEIEGFIIFEEKVEE